MRAKTEAQSLINQVRQRHKTPSEPARLLRLPADRVMTQYPGPTQCLSTIPAPVPNKDHRVEVAAPHLSTLGQRRLKDLFCCNDFLRVGGAMIARHNQSLNQSYMPLQISELIL